MPWGRPMTDRVPTPEERPTQYWRCYAQFEPVCHGNEDECWTCSKLDKILAALSEQREALPEGHDCHPENVPDIGSRAHD